jgi:hypothetical protein
MAEGGELSFVRSGSDWDEVHVFTSGGTLKVNRAPKAGTVRVLVVAGGGGGGANGGGDTHGSGGGAGGLIMSNGLSLTASSYTVAVGAGGPGGALDGPTGYANEKAAVQSYNGKDSSIAGAGLNGLTALGGGGGAWYFIGNVSVGGDGGSGGGGGGKGTDGQGKNGNGNIMGDLKWGGGGYTSSGHGPGGDGAGGAGLAQTAIPAAVDVSGIPLEFSRGGSCDSMTAGARNTGNGGGGGNQSNGAPGGSGIVIVRFLYTSAAP